MKLASIAAASSRPCARQRDGDRQQLASLMCDAKIITSAASMRDSKRKFPHVPSFRAGVRCFCGCDRNGEYRLEEPLHQIDLDNVGLRFVGVIHEAGTDVRVKR
nr:hypothetical protein [Paraburkholderia sp. BL8N3]